MRRLPVQLLLLWGMAAAPAALSALIHPHRPSWTGEALRPDEITAATAAAWGRQILWVDARPAEAYQRGHIPGAIHLDEMNWESQFGAVVDAWRPGQRVVVYCDGGRCQASRQVARRLREEVGLPEVYALKGGQDAWLRVAR